MSQNCLACGCRGQACVTQCAQVFGQWPCCQIVCTHVIVVSSGIIRNCPIFSRHPAAHKHRKLTSAIMSTCRIRACAGHMQNQAGRHGCSLTCSMQWCRTRFGKHAMLGRTMGCRIKAAIALRHSRRCWFDAMPCAAVRQYEYNVIDRSSGCIRNCPIFLHHPARMQAVSPSAHAVQVHA